MGRICTAGGINFSFYISLQRHSRKLIFMKTALNCVLLIDDDEPTNYINKMLIEEAHCTKQVEVVQGGQAALNYLSSFASNPEPGQLPELIFLDINMPAMN